MNSLSLKLSLILVTSLSLFAFSYFSSNDIDKFFVKVENNADWKTVKSHLNLDEQDILSRYKEQVGFGPKDVLVKHRESSDEKGNIHLHYQHYHNGFRVFGSQIILHKRDNRIYLVNGTIVENLDQKRNFSIEKDEAIEIAKNEYKGAKFMWENEFMENWIKKQKKNPTATFAPAAPIVYYQKDFSRIANQYTLAYEIDIHTFAPEKKAVVYVDALSGEIIDIINDLHSGGDHEGVAETKYHGTRNIITDSVGQDSFALIDSTRGPGIFTLDAQRNSDVSLYKLFYDDDNYWNNVNGFQDEVATDVHWGAEMTYDFYTNVLGRQGMSADTVPLISFVHVDQDWTNATWNGVFARFGDSAPPNSPLTAIDVVGHEFAHGLTDYTADLVYMDEPGALNESFSDIFGTAQEFIYDSLTADWFIGEDFIAAGGFRSMSNPKAFNNPDTYFGLMWATGAGDNGGVHSNSGVQNFWFYLITEGGSGLNDLGNSYFVDSLGLDKSIQIAYGNLNNYLTVTSQYTDARLGSIQAARDLYGDCGIEVETTTNAWYAVGVGDKFERNDISLIEVLGPSTNICGISTDEQLSVRLTYNNCTGPLLPGEIIPFEYSLNFGEVYYDTLFLTDTIFTQDTLDYTFNNTIAEFNEPGDYELNISSTLVGDNIESNNSLREFFRIQLEQNFDLGYARTLSPVSACYLSDQEEISVRLQFLGCDSIVGGEMLTIMYKLDGADWISEDFSLDSTFYADEFIDFTFTNSTVDLSTNKDYTFEAQLIYGPDTLEQNNASEVELFENPLPLQKEVMFHFDGIGETPQDSFYLISGSKSIVTIEDSVGFKSTKGLAIKGNDGLDQLIDNRIQKPVLNNVWSGVNRDFISETCMCADLTNSTQARLKYRINQTYSPIYEDIFGIKMQYASAMRVTANGVKLTATSIPIDNEGNPYLLKNHNLVDYLGGTVELCFQTHTLLDAENDPYGIGDNIYIDEVIIDANTAVSPEETQLKSAIIYPNPSSDQFQVINNWNGEYTIEIYDTKGSKVFRIDNYTDKTPINVLQLSEGMYFVKSTLENDYSISKLIIK